MFTLLGLLLLQPVSPWQFHDETQYQGRSMLLFRSVELASKSPKAITTRFPADVQYGLLRLGIPSASPMLLTWHATKNELWLDQNDDGIVQPGEKHQLQQTPLSLPVTITIAENTKVQRTLYLKRRGTGLSAAVRGYVTGTITIDQKSYAAAILDGNADGCFDAANEDRLLVDLDKSGSFDGVTEQFTLGTPLVVAGKLFLVKSNPAGTEVVATVRPQETGIVRLKITQNDQHASVTHFSAHLLSNWGEMIEVKELGTAQKLPIGKYTLTAVTLTILDAERREWRYSFSSNRSFQFNIDAGSDRFVDVLPDLKLKLYAAGQAKAGERVQLQPNLETSTGLYVTSGYHTSNELTARLELCAQGSVLLDMAESGFH
jgi:hypothetical protein